MTIKYASVPLKSVLLLLRLLVITLVCALLTGVAVLGALLIVCFSSRTSAANLTVDL